MNSLHLFFFRRTLETGTEKRHVVPGGGDALKDLVEMHLRSPRERVLDVLPVENENAHESN